MEDPNSSAEDTEVQSPKPEVTGKAADAGFLIFCVGINYDQEDHPPDPTAIPHIFNRSKGRTWVVDNSWPIMRQALDAALANYLKHPKDWEDNGYASPPGLLPGAWRSMQAPFPYTLAMTNLSPFLSMQCWCSYPPAIQSSALTAWAPNHHLCDLINLLGNQVDLWVIHGKSAVWPRFLGTSSLMKPWIMTPNLSRQPLNSGQFETFWKTPLSGPTMPPFFPKCLDEKEEMFD